MLVVVFEDNRTGDFYPLSQTRPVWDIRSGLFTIKDRIEHIIKDSFGSDTDFFYVIREYLTPYAQEQFPGCNIDDKIFMNYRGEILFINSVCDLWSISGELKNDTVIKADGRIMAARLSSVDLNSGYDTFVDDLSVIVEHSRVSVIENDRALLFGNIWNIMDKNPEMIQRDFEYYENTNKVDNPRTVTFKGEWSLVCIDKKAVVDPFVCIDTSKGPVVIEAGVEVHPFTRIDGPCYIGQDTVILGARIRSGTSIGPVCRIGGEIEQSIFQGYSNKYHDGFIGHSHIGTWVNMGALTTNSDLKNNYASVQVFTPDGVVDTDNRKIGCFIGDFAKTSIGTLINTGSVIGSGAMLVHNGDITPYHIPPFAWYFKSKINDDRGIDDFLDAARSMTERRGVIFSDNFANMLKYVYYKYKGKA